MASILDLLRRCVAGDSIKKASAIKGGEWHSPCPKCGGTDRFIIFPEQDGGALARKNGLRGTWSCPRHCDNGGDILDFCTVHLGLSFTEACTELGIALEKQENGARRAYRPMRQLPKQRATAWVPAAYAAPADVWVQQATKLAQEAHTRLLDERNIMTYLAKRGLPMEAVVRYGLGYIEGEDKTGTCIFRQRTSFGLSLRTKTDGKTVRALRIPRGITIPCWGDSHPRKALRIRIRRRDADIDRTNPKDPKFQLIPQETAPYSAPMILFPHGVSLDLATWVVVEAELDAMLVHHACGGRVGVVSILTVSGKPDKRAHEFLTRAARILFAIDFEQNAQGEFHTAKHWKWWSEQYSQAKLWPVPKGKDPGEAYSLGVDIAQWIFLAMPEATIYEGKKSGDLGAKKLGKCCFGVKGKEIRLPLYFTYEDIPRDVRILAKLWQGKPIYFQCFHDAGGSVIGFEWNADEAWKSKNQKKWSVFLRFQARSAHVRDWVFSHVDTFLTADNFLFVFGRDE